MSALAPILVTLTVETVKALIDAANEAKAKQLTTLAQDVAIADASAAHLLAVEAAVLGKTPEELAGG